MISKLNLFVLFLSSLLFFKTVNAQAASSPSRSETKTAYAFYTASNQSHGPMDATVTLEYYFFREYIGDKYFLGINIHYQNMQYSPNYGGYRFKLNGKIYTQQELQLYDSRGIDCFTDVVLNKVTIRDLGITGVSKKITYYGAINRFDGLLEISKTQDLNTFSLITATSTCSDIGYNQNYECVSKRINDFDKGVKNAFQKTDQLEKNKRKESDLATQNAQNTGISESNRSSSTNGNNPLKRTVPINNSLTQANTDAFLAKNEAKRLEREAQNRKDIAAFTKAMDHNVQSYYAMQAINETRNTVQENMTLSENYANEEELERAYNTKFQTLDQSINVMHKQEQDHNLNTIDYYSTQTTGNTQLYGTIAAGGLYFINEAQNKIEEKRAKENLRIQKEQAAIEIRNKKIVQRQAMRVDLFNMFPEGGIPMSSHRISTDELYFFVYNFDEASLRDGSPKIEISNVFPISKYGDGTWPFKSVILSKIQKSHNIGKTTLVGYYTTKEMADKMRASFIRMAAKSGMTIEDFIYKGSPRNNSSTATSIDYWDNTEKSSTTKKTKPIEKKSEPAKPKLDFWDDSIKE
mgnify:CR=1 FL=1